MSLFSAPVAAETSDHRRECSPETGLIANLLEDEVAVPDTPPEYSPVVPLRDLANDIPPTPPTEPEPESHTQVEPEPELKPEPSTLPEDEKVLEPPLDSAAKEEGTPDVVLDSPMSEPPTSPHAEGQKEAVPTLQSHDEQVDDAMEVEDFASPKPQVPDVQETLVPSSPTQEPGAAEQKTEESMTEPAFTADVIPVNSSPHLLQSRMLSAPLKDPSPPPVNTTPDKAACRQASIARASAPRSEHSPDLPVLHIAEGPDAPDSVKVEQLDDEAMDVVDMQLDSEPQEEVLETPLTPVPDATWVPPTVVSPAQLSLVRDEDRVMTILGPSLPRISLPPDVVEHPSSAQYSIPLPLSEPELSYSFGDGENGATDFEELQEKFPSLGPDPPYPLPPMSLLPIEFSRRKASKRKRDKEKDGKKEEWQPMGLNKWAAVLKANPVHTKLQKATKCLSTRDWSVR